MGKKIGVLLGGLSTERQISLQSGTAVVEALKARGHDVVAIDVWHDLPAQLIAHKIDVAWIALHGRFGEDGCVQGLLEVMGIPYTGSDVQASAVAMDKLATKRALRGVAAVVMADDAVLRQGQPRPAVVPLPSVVKPVVGGSSIGIEVVRTPAELDVAVAQALKLDGCVLVEALIEGLEITVAVLDGVALPVVSIEPVDGWFDLEAKYTKGRTVYTVPAKISPIAAAKAQAAAVAAYTTLGCAGLARADFMLPAGPDADPIFLEINTLPGMTPMSLSPMAAGEVGMDFSDLCERILQGAHRMAVETERTTA